MVSTQSKYDMEYVSGEFGDTYTITVLNDDGTAADLTVYDAAKLTIAKIDGTVLFSTTTLTLSSPNVLWVMLVAQTTALNYFGEARGQLQLTSTTTKKRMTKKYTVFIYENQVP